MAARSNWFQSRKPCHVKRRPTRPPGPFAETVTTRNEVGPVAAAGNSPTARGRRAGRAGLDDFRVHLHRCHTRRASRAVPSQESGRNRPTGNAVALTASSHDTALYAGRFERTDALNSNRLSCCELRTPRECNRDM